MTIVAPSATPGEGQTVPEDSGLKPTDSQVSRLVPWRVSVWFRESLLFTCLSKRNTVFQDDNFLQIFRSSTVCFGKQLG